MKYSNLLITSVVFSVFIFSASTSNAEPRSHPREINHHSSSNAAWHLSSTWWGRHWRHRQVENRYAHGWNHEQTYNRHRRDQHRLDQHQSRYEDRHDRSHWSNIGEFRTKKGRSTSKAIRINQRIVALELEGTRRATFVRRAFIEFGDGHLKRVPELEGTIRAGELLRLRLRHGTYVRRLHIEVSPTGYDRAYAKVNYRSA